jgi:predicted lipid-binding transport protein (Tim44 family)
MMNGMPRRPMPQTAGGMGPYGAGGGGYAPRVQAQPLKRPERQPEAAPAKSGDGGMLGGMMGGMMSGLSDKHSKEEISRLEGANEALSRALSSSASYPDTNAPSSGMQALGQQNAPPSHANFADTPAANKVAAQNVGMQQGSGPPPVPMAQGNGNPAFNVNRGAPDLSALDEAYKRMGQGG